MTLAFSPDSIVLDTRHLIGGVRHADILRLPFIRPSDGETAAELPLADAALVDQAVQAAHRALQTSGWARAIPRDRTRALHRWADLIEARADELARLEAVVSTRPVDELPTGDIAVTAEQIRFFAELADKEGGTVAPTREESLGLIIDAPIGVIGAITPWNFPLSMAGWKMGPALAAGNAIVLKPSEMTPFATLRMAELAVEAGIPAGLISILLGDGPTTGAALVAHPGIGKVSFTGSTQAGAAIAGNLAATGLKPMTLELGGKSPQVVLADADLDLAARSIARSILFNAGQACVAGSRVIVARPVADALCEKLLGLMGNPRVAPTWGAGAGAYPIISARQIGRIDAIVQASRRAGAELLTGGGALEAEGYFLRRRSSPPRTLPIPPCARRSSDPC